MPEEKKDEELGEFPDKLSKEIMENIKKEQEETPKSPEQEEPEEEPESKPEEESGEDNGEQGEESEPEEGDAGEDEEVEEEGEEEAEPKRTPKLVELYKFKIAQKKWEKEKKELEERIRELSEQNKGKTEAEKSEGIKEFAEKYGIDESFVSDLLKLAKPNVSTAEFQEELKALKEEKEWQKQYQEFDKEFTDKVEPILIEDNIPEKKRPKLKSLMRELAFTERFASWPADDIYTFLKAKGQLDDFMPKEGKKSAESSRGGARGKESESIKEIIENMSEEEFLKWSDEQAKKSGGSRYEFSG